MSNYIAHPRTRSHWLCADGSIIQEPRVEQTPAGRRVRIRGNDESHTSHELTHLLYRWVYQQARRKGTAPVLNLQCDPENEDARGSLIGLQVANSVDTYSRKLRETGSFTPFTENATSSTAIWVFRHASLPLFAAVVMVVDLKGSYTSLPSVTFKVGFPNLSQGNATNHTGGYDGYSSHYRPSTITYGVESTKALGIHTEFIDRVVEILESNGVTWGKQSYPNNEAAMADAIRGYRHIDSLSTLNLPDYRRIKPAVNGLADDSSLGTFAFTFEEAKQPESYLAEMQEYAEMLAPANAIVDAWTTIQKELARRGVTVGRKNEHEVLELLTGASDELTVELTPINRLAGKFAQDSNHRVTLNIIKGIVHVGCDHQHDQQADLLAYELAKERASITGETDLLEAFMASVGKVRQDHEIDRIVTEAHRTAYHHDVTPSK